MSWINIDKYHQTNGAYTVSKAGIRDSETQQPKAIFMVYFNNTFIARTGNAVSARQRCYDHAQKSKQGTAAPAEGG